MAGPEDHDPLVEDWFEDEAPTRERQPPLRRRPSLPPSDERRIPAIALLGGAALIILLIIVIVALTGNGETPAPEPGTGLPTTVEPAEPGETEPSPTGEAPTTLPTEEIIRPGDEGDQVVALQQALAELGHDPGEVDGNYGPATVEAVRAFQTGAGLPPDGIAGPDTLNAINQALAAQG